MTKNQQDRNRTDIQRDVNTSGGDFIGRDKNIQISINPTEKERLQSLLPPPPSLFVGRDDDLRKIKTRLINPESDAVNLLVLRGWPGIGKTTLAKRLAHDEVLTQHFSDGILWTELGTRPNLMGTINAWAHALGSDILFQADDIQQAQNLLASLLKDKQVLVIIDDIWQTEHAQPFFVTGKHGAILSTTRINQVARNLATSPTQIYPLSGLNDEESLNLLNKITPNVVKKYPDQILDLVHALEGLPLALRVAGSLLEAENSLNFNIINLLEKLKNDTHILEAESPPDRADLVNETTPTVAALLFTSIEMLDEQTRDYYAYLGAFAPKPATFDQEAMKFVWNVDDPQPIIRTLEERGLLDVLPNGRYQMHALMALLAKTLLKD